MKKLIAAVLSITIASCSLSPAYADDLRYCGPPERYANGEIKRSSYVLYKFKQLYACPSTGLNTGKCPDWAIDHVIPRACGGCDTIENLQWLPNAIKSAAGTLPKDRWERKVYCTK